MVDQSKPKGNSSVSSTFMRSQKGIQMSRSGKRKAPYNRVRSERTIRSGSPSKIDRSVIKIEPIDTEFDQVTADSIPGLPSISVEFDNKSEFYEDNVGTMDDDENSKDENNENVRTDRDFNTRSTGSEPGTSGYRVELNDPDMELNNSSFSLGDSMDSQEKLKHESANLNITEEAGTSAEGSEVDRTSKFLFFHNVFNPFPNKLCV